MHKQNLDRTIGISNSAPNSEKLGLDQFERVVQFLDDDLALELVGNLSASDQAICLFSDVEDQINWVLGGGITA